MAIKYNILLFGDSVNNCHFLTADLEEASLKTWTDPVSET